MSIRIPFTLIAGCAATLACVGNVSAQSTYPARPIRIVIGTSAGAGSELMARLVGQGLTQAWGQPIVVDPRPGAGGNIAAEHVAKSPPDGYTLYVCFGSHTVNPSLFSRPGYEPIKDFAPITLIARQPNALAVHPSVPAKNVRELVSLAKSRPGKLTYGTAGQGSPTHLGMELFKSTAGFDVVHIPCKGAAPALVDLLGGHVDMMFGVLRTLLPQAQGGKLRLLALANPQRLPLVPALPTIEEAGWQGIDVVTWHGLLAPAGTPRAIVEQIAQEARRTLSAPSLREKFIKDGIVAVVHSPAEFDAFLRTDADKWRQVVQATGVRAD